MLHKMKTEYLFSNIVIGQMYVHIQGQDAWLNIPNII